CRPWRPPTRDASGSCSWVAMATGPPPVTNLRQSSCASDSTESLPVARSCRGFAHPTKSRYALDMTAQVLPLARLWPIRDVLTFSFDLELRAKPASLRELGLSENAGSVFADDATGGLYATWAVGSRVYGVNIDSWG